ncbi:MAG: methanol/ethanol family PQQ-dependent dehydrogenase [Methylibium sp.]|uniref:methanol/ethanol family PQQ-dependent dehydrogenase n=1 Tax=Methylibium sp. TaxID=2067992 RepID=UPI0018109444|nr:methanol/ethanol family PQQ-dependent dehydrogenase [Methylibium sp.]MBA3595917.1 methanol/ethanol family PQQ-dependent dehydrogenase [Methylibium sp.]
MDISASLRAVSLALLFGSALHPPAAAQAAGAEWTTPAGTLEGTRFSSLAQIHSGNVGQLEEEFRFRTGVIAGHEGTPLVVGSTMYVVSPFPNKLFALDLADRGRLRWVFDPRADPFAQDKACCDIVNRGAVHANGKIIYNVLDNTTVAVDARTGREVWRTKLGDPATGQTMTMAPLVVGDKVLVGNSGGELGIRGFIAALNLNTGIEVWRAFSTGPDVDVLIGAGFNPFYAKDRGADLGAATWPSEFMWQHGGSTVWGFVSYDPQLNLIYYGTANPGVWNPDLRPGDNKWSTTLFARNPDTGQAAWAYQITPHDAWDFDGVNENIVVNLPFGDTTRQLLVRFDRNGFAYTMDRKTGEVLVAEKFVFVNWAERIDLGTGAPVENPAKRPREGVNVRDICPAGVGGKDQQPAAFSPRTNLFYVPTNNLCMDYEALKVNFIEGTPFVGASVRMKAGPDGLGHRGEFMAWDATSGRKVWGIAERFPVWSGVLATAGDVVFYGTLDRRFKAVHAVTGQVLLDRRLESGIVGHPMTFLGPDGKQRVAIYSGPGGVAGAIVPAELSPDDPFAGLGIVGAMADLPRFTPAGGAVHVFKLP